METSTGFHFFLFFVLKQSGGKWNKKKVKHYDALSNEQLKKKISKKFMKDSPHQLSFFIYK